MSQDNPTRPTLLLRLRDHEDQASWTEFVEIYGPLIHRFALSRGVSSADVGDVTQEVLRSVARALRKFEYDRDKGTFRGWLFTAVRREIARLADKARRQPGTPGFDDPASRLNAIASREETQVWERDYHRQMMHWAISKVRPEFSEATWQAFELTAIEGLSANEVAERIDASPGSIYVSKSRVLKRLREKIHSVAAEAWEIEVIGAQKA